MDVFRNRRVIVASVGLGPFANHGNSLIERSTFRLLGLPSTTPRFSVFEPIDDALLERINAHDYLVVTGCTTLQDDPGHQGCFDDQFRRIRIPRICLAGTFYCEPEERPSLRIARLYDCPIGARDPWAAEYLTRHGIACEFIGCPTLLDGDDRDDWRRDDGGDILVSSTPPLVLAEADLPAGRRRRYLSHDTTSPGERLLEDGVFASASLVLTGRLHAALPALARGIRARFFDQRHWHPDYRWQQYGSIRYTLLDHLGIPRSGADPGSYPATRIRALKRACGGWLRGLVNAAVGPTRHA